MTRRTTVKAPERRGARPRRRGSVRPGAPLQRTAGRILTIGAVLVAVVLAVLPIPLGEGPRGARHAPASSEGGTWREDRSVLGPLRPAGLPSAPLSVLAVPHNTSVNLSWTAPSSTGGSNLTGYDVVWSPAGNSTGTATGGLRPWMWVKGLSNGLTYTFQVAARNAAGTGPFAPPVTAVPGTAPPAPLGPHVRVENATAFVGWAAPPASLQLPIVSYRLELNSSAGNRTVLTTFPQATLTGLTRGAAYTARVAAANALGYGPRSASTYFVAFGAPAGALGLTLAYDPARSQLTLTWEPFAPSSVAPVDNLTIAWGSSNGSTGMARMGPTSTSWTLRGVAPGQTYTFGLWAGGPGGNGTPAEISRALPPTSPGSSSLFNEPLAILGEFLAFTFAIVLALAARARGARPGAPNGRRRISSDQRGPSTGPAPAGGPAPGGSPTRSLPYPYVEAGSPRSSSDTRAPDPYGARLPRAPPAPILPAGRERPPRR